MKRLLLILAAVLCLFRSAPAVYAQDASAAGRTWFAPDKGTANAYVVSIHPTPHALQVGMLCTFQAANANTGASTLTLNNNAAVNIVKNGSVALVAGDIAVNAVVTCVYDGTYWQLQNPNNFGEATVTQLTSITTGVTINGPSGVITTVSASTAGGSTSTFTVTNSAVVSTSVIVATLGGYSGTLGTNGSPIITVNTIGSGSFHVTIYNAHASNALSGILTINFVVE